MSWTRHTWYAETGSGLAPRAVALASLLLLAAGCSPVEKRDWKNSELTFAGEPAPVLLPPPPIDDEYFPCDDCHEGEPANPTVRELDEHDGIELAHDDLWCLDCHDSDQRGTLHLSSGQRIALEESWRLCTRCHGHKLDDWRAGIHGKRTGYWRGPKEYRTCVVCHDPHAPRFEPVEPEPRPLRASEIRLDLLVHQPEAANEDH